MMKKLLSFAVLCGFALTASASIPCPIKSSNDYGGGAANGNGYHYETDDDGTIHCTTSTASSIYNEGSGFQWQTQTIKKDKTDWIITKDYNIIAIDYKTNTACPSGFYVYFIFNGEFANDFFFNQGQVTTVSDEWQTMYLYAPIKNDVAANNGSFGRPENFSIFEVDSIHAKGGDYLWLRFDYNYMTPESHPNFTIDIKNPRWLTMAEMETELATQTLTGDQPVYISPQLANADLTVDQDGDKLYFSYSGALDEKGQNTSNGVVNLVNPLIRLYPQNRIFKMEYQVEFANEETTSGIYALIPLKSLNVYAGYGLDGAATVVTLESKYGLDNSEDAWGEITWDLTNLLSDAYTLYPISVQGIWFQCNNENLGTPKESMFSLRNARWTSADSGLENIAADAANGAVTYYNLQGVKVANPTNGLYIKKQGNSTSKVLVK